MNLTSHDEFNTSEGNTGYLFSTEQLTILNLHGSYDEMGQQYGALVKDQLNKIYHEIAKTYFDGLNITTAIAYIFKEYYRFKMDSRERKILKGIAKTSNLTYDQLLELDVLPLLIILFGKKQPSNNPNLATLLTEYMNNSNDHCSFLSVWGERSEEHCMLSARNLDLSKSVDIIELCNYFSLIIYQPDNGNNKVATWGFLGSIPGFTWANDKGLFSEYNAGDQSVPGYDFIKGFLGLNIIFYALLEVVDANEFINYLKANPPLISYITAIVNANQALTIEYPAREIPVVLPEKLKNVVYTTNLYDTEFKNAKLTLKNCVDKVKDTRAYACCRYHVIEAYINKHPIINIDKLKHLFTTSMDEGGIYHTGLSTNYPTDEITAYTLIGNVEKEEYYFSHFNNKDSWLAIDLRKLFNN